MITHRRRGFINLYSFVCGLLAVALFYGFAAILPWVPRIEILPALNLTPYVLAIIVGVVASSRLFAEISHKLHALHGSQVLSLAFQQTCYIGACLFTLMFATKDREISRLFLGGYLVLLGCGFTILHRRFPRYFAQTLFPENSHARTLFVGRKATPEELLIWAKDHEHLGIYPVGYLADVACEDSSVLADVPRLGSTKQIGEIIRERHVTQVILLDWLDDPAEMERMVEICLFEGCRFLIYNSFSSKFARNLTALDEGGQHFLAVQEEPLEDPVNRALKRSLDIALSLPVVVFVIPPLAFVVWICQRWQAPGPVVYVQSRGGQQGRVFPIYKFRSMWVDNPDVSRQATIGDGRVYPFGSFLRRSSLDEFPQFYNVLRGEMSLVGPRPHLPQHDTAFSQIARTYRSRSLVKPGITGLAQIKGYRGEIDDPDKLHQRVYWDLYYVTNWTIWMDMRIIMRTFWVVIVPPKTAY